MYTRTLFVLSLSFVVLSVPFVVSAQAVPSCVAIQSTLRMGSRGTEVTELQNFLVSKKLLTSSSATGYFGPQTRLAVQKFQVEQKIVSSGNELTTGFGAVGARTRAAMGAPCQKNAAQTAPGNTSKAGAACVPTVFPLSTVPQGIVNQPWMLPLLTIQDGVQNPTLTTEGLPAGITLQDKKVVSTSTGTTHNWVLAGTSTQVGFFTVTVSAKNACSRSATSIQFTVSSSSPWGFCPAYTLPICSSGPLVSLGTDSHGCSLGYECPKIPTVACVAPETIVCSNGPSVSSGEDANGCAVGNQCMQTTAEAFSASPASGKAPVIVHFAIQNTLQGQFYSIDFGDKSFSDQIPGGAASIKLPSHTYTTPGIHIVKLLKIPKCNAPVGAVCKISGAQVVGTTNVTVR